MRRKVMLFALPVLFFLIVGAISPNVEKKVTQKIKSKSVTVRNPAVSSAENQTAIPAFKTQPVITKYLSVPKEASGASEKSGIVYPTKGTRYANTIDSFPAPRTNNNGLEWDGRYLWLVSGNGSGSYATVNALDPEDGSVNSTWDMPTTGNCMGAGFVNDIMYVADWTNGMIRKVTKAGALIASYAAPGGTYVRGVSSDGEYLYITSTAGDTLFKTDTLMNIQQQWYIGGIVGWSMDIAYVGKDGTIWILDSYSDLLKQMDISGGTPVLLNSYTPPGNPSVNRVEGIAFDGSDMWFNTFYGDQIYRIDVGYSLSRVALFQDREPWTFRSNKDILYANGIPFKVFTSSDMGFADLSIYTKVIISSVQPGSLYQHIETNRTWWESWISAGGVFELNGADYIFDPWSGLVMPGGFTSSHPANDTVNIVSSWHPIVNIPNQISDGELDNWAYSTHGYLVNLPLDAYEIIRDSIPDEPAAAIFRFGDGGVIATMQPLGYAWYYGYSGILENMILYWDKGVSPNVLMAISDYDQPDTRGSLMGYLDIGNVDHMNTRYYTPMMHDLSLYDVIFTWPNSPHLDKDALGDTLAAFVDGGKWVITCGFSWYTQGNSLGGAIMTSIYNPFSSPTGGNHHALANLGWHLAHPIMSGVTSVSDRYRDSLVINPGADSVAKWDDSEWFIGTMDVPYPAGGVLGFNGLPGDYGNWTGDMMLLLHNAITWAKASGIDDNPIVSFDNNLRILKVLPNPFIHSTEIYFEIPNTGNVAFKIFNVAGQEVAGYQRMEKTAGVKSISWDGRNKKGNPVSSGVYFYGIELNGERVTGKLTAIR